MYLQLRIPGFRISVLGWAFLFSFFSIFLLADKYSLDCNECLGQCSGNNCSSYASCANTVGSYTCSCNLGFQGSGSVCTDIDECVIVPAVCPSNSTCNNTIGSYTCSCNSGYFGTSACPPCPSGTYQNLAGQSGCISCILNSQSPAGSSLASNCTCLPGYQLQTGSCQGNTLLCLTLTPHSSLLRCDYLPCQ